MKNLRDSFEPIRFTQEEKMDLAARLAQAAEQEEDMTDSTKRKIKKISGGMVFGVAAALTLSVGALAAAIGPSLHTWFDTQTTGAQEWLDGAIAPINRTLEHNGWTMTLTECVGDDYLVYLWVELTAPEGTSLAAWDGDFPCSIMIDGVFNGTRSSADDIPGDNRTAMWYQTRVAAYEGGLRGRPVDIVLEPEECWSSQEEEKARWERMWESAEEIRDHVWVFEDVVLDYPDQAVRLEPNVEVPYMGGTTTLTYLEVTPLTLAARVEGGACYDHHNYSAKPWEPPEITGGREVEVGGATITIGGMGKPGGMDEIKACWDALELEVHMKDGTVLSNLTQTTTGGSCDDGLDSPEGARSSYVHVTVNYHPKGESVFSQRFLGLDQIDHITICGVDFPITREMWAIEETPETPEN